MSCRTMPYLSGNNTVQSPNQTIEIFSPWWQGISGGGPFSQYRTKAKLSAYRGPNPSAWKHRMTPKEALEPLASYLDNDHLIPPPISFSRPFLFQCGHQRVTRTPNWNLASISLSKYLCRCWRVVFFFFFFACVYCHFNVLLWGHFGFLVKLLVLYPFVSCN